MSRTKRVVLLTDLHLRSDYIPGYLQTQVDTLTRLVNQKPTDAVVINGDIFHRRNPRGSELLAFRELLEGLECQDIYINRGNHDTISKSGSTETTLSLFSDIAKVFSECGTERIAGVDFDFIPHFEHESDIVKAVKESKNHMFGHFGYDGCQSHGNYKYDSYLKRSHFTKGKYSFLGHIHLPQIQDNIHILGTQYSTSFGEANAQKWLTSLLIRDGKVEVHRKKIDYGIRHISCGLHNIDEMNAKFRFKDFFTLLRLKLDTLDSYVENTIKDEILSKYTLAHLEVVFDDVLPKLTSNYSKEGKLLTIDDDIINTYIDESDVVFSKEELLEGLNQIRTYEN